MQLVKLAGTAVISLTLIAACGGSPTTPTVGPGATPAPVSTPAPNATPTAPPAAATNPPVGGTVDICSLITNAELTAATGEEYVHSELDEFGQCYWNTDDSGVNSGSLIVGTFQVQALSFIKSAFGAGGVDLTVGGRPAFWNPGGGIGSIWVDLGDGRLFTLSFPRSDDLDPSYQGIAQQLAEIAVTRM